MPYLVIEDFKGGLDKRRMEVTSPLGSLQILKNAHISRGGEIEKALAFVEKYNDLEDTFDLAGVRESLYVFGSGPRPALLNSDINYQRLQTPNGDSLVRVISHDVFAGKIYVVAEFDDGFRYHFFDGEIISDWYDGLVKTEFVDNDGIAEHLKSLIDLNANFSATRTGSVIEITGATDDSFEITSLAENGENNLQNDQTASIATTQEAVDGQIEIVATGSFRIIGGTNSPGTNEITSVLINGATEILINPVDWATSNSFTAAAIATEINLHTGSTTYSASNQGDRVIISAAVGTGDSPNGFTVGVTSGGDVVVADITALNGGVDAGSGQPQISTVTIGGTFEPGDRFSVTLNENVFGADRVTGLNTGSSLKVHKNKVYTASLSTLLFSAVAEPAQWKTEDIGSGAIDMSTQASGFEDVTAIGIYQDNLAVFSRRATQIWFVDPDPDANTQLQVLNNIGTRSPGTVVSFGDSDVFFLSDTGVRSLRARDSSNAAAVSDVGTPIDTLVVADMASLTEDQIEQGQGIIEPKDGRYIMSLGGKMYVFSFFSSSKVSSWSTYERNLQIQRFVIAGNKVYARAGNSIYLLGGDNGETYDDEEVIVELPFMSANKDATWKRWTGIDIAVEGTWDIYVCTDPNRPTTFEKVATVHEHTFNEMKAGMIANAPMIKMKFVNTSEGYGRIGAIVLHFETERDE